MKIDNATMKIDNATKRLLTDPKKRRVWIIYQVSLLGRSLAQVADEAGVSRQCLYQVFNHPYPRMEKVVADALGMTPMELWPERYDADGLPIRRRGRPKKSVSKETQNNTRAKRRNIHTRKVA